MRMDQTKQTANTQNQTVADSDSPRMKLKSMLIRSGFAVLAAAAAPALAQVSTEDIKLLPDDPRGGNRFGWSVAIDNEFAAVGAYADNDNGSWSGSVYLFDTFTGAQRFKLLPDSDAAFDEFGKAVDIDAGIVAVASHQDDDTVSNSGSAYLFDAGTGDQMFKLFAADPDESDRFGRSIAIDGGVVAVGADQDDDLGTSSGSVYLFDASTGNQTAKLVPTDGAAGDVFGDAVDVSSGIVVVGAKFDDDNGTDSGSVYLYEAATGSLISKITPDDGAAYDFFGYAVAIDGDTLVVGAPGDGGTGSVYVFDAVSGDEITKVRASDPAAQDLFGNSVAIDGDVLVVGSRYDDDNGTDSGAMYQFTASTGAQISKFWPTDGAANDEFGCDVAVSSGVIISGAWLNDETGEESGAAYLFDVMCPSSADVNHDGMLSPTDFTAWIAAFNTNAQECDQNSDGVCSPTDFSAWIANYNAGCP
jgi:hypothetical protein